MAPIRRKNAMDRNTSIPDGGICPKCNGQFFVKARTITAAWKLTATDELAWVCAACGYATVEARCKGDGVNGEWPVSLFLPAI